MYIHRFSNVNFSAAEILVLNQETCAQIDVVCFFFFRTQIRKTVVKTKKTEPLPCLIATGHDFSGMSGSMCSMLAMGSMGATSQP